MTTTTTTFQAARLAQEIEAIIHAVALDCGVTVGAVKSRSRAEPLATYRQIGMLLLREKTPASYPAIALAFNRAHHGTAIHGCEAARNKAAQDPRVALRLERLRQRADVIIATPATPTTK